MKPTFALTLDEDRIGLLQQTPQGWLSLGSVAFGAADMDEALASLRDKAEALSDGPLVTKLVIPNDQILYDRVSSRGPSRAARKAQIAAALAGRTPYALDELIYDWAGEGPEVDVAAIAIETLSEAEDFAKTHGFNPVAFVAIPPSGYFARTEPWFGTTQHLETLPFRADLSLLAEQPITIFDPDAPEATQAEIEIEVEADPQIEPEAPEAETEPEADTEPPQEQPAPEPVKTARLSLNTAHFPTLPSFTEADDTSSFGEKGNPFFDMLAARAQAHSEPQDALAPAPVEALPDLHAAFADEEGELAIDMAVGSRSGNLLDFDDYDAAEPQFEPHKPAAQHIELEPETDDPTGADFKEEELLEIPQAFWNTIDLTNAPPEVRATEPEAFAPVAPSQTVESQSPTERPTEALPAPTEPAAPEEAPFVEAPANPADEAVEPPVTEAAEERPAPQPEPEPEVQVPPLPIPPRVTQPNRGEARPLGKPAPILGEPSFNEGPRRGGAPARITPPAPQRPQMAIEVGKGSSLRAEPAAPVTGTETILAAAASLAPHAPSAPSIPTPAAALAQMRPATESETMKVFGMSAQGASKQVGGKPRYLGLILTAVLVVVLLLVALWAAMLVDPVPSEASLDEPPPVTQLGEATQGSEQQASVDPTEAFVDPAPVAPDMEVATSAPSAPQLSGTTDTAAPNLPQPEAAVQSTPPATLEAAQGNADVAPADVPVLQPLGSSYTFDAQGRIQPTPEGVITPEGISLFAGRPDPLPPQRPAGLAPEAAAETVPPAPETAPQPPQDAAAPNAGATITLPTTGESDLEAPFEPNEAAPKVRPPARPQDVIQSGENTEAAPPEVQAASQEALLDLVTPRPPKRGPAVAAAAKAAAEAQALQANQIAAAAAAAASAASTVGQGAEQASLMPTIRPSARPASLQASTARAPSAAAEEEEDEPEVVTRSNAPRIPTQASVARQATVTDGIDLGRLNLIGVFGTSNNRVALVRDGRGRLSRVRVGDSIDGGQVTAISASELSYRKGRNEQRLQMPRS